METANGLGVADLNRDCRLGQVVPELNVGDLITATFGTTTMSGTLQVEDGGGGSGSDGGSGGGGGGGGGGSVDTVTITEAKYTSNKDELKIKATSSHAPGAILCIEGLGQLKYKNGNKYELKFKPLAPTSPPSSVTVVSSLGGSATASVVGAPPSGGGGPPPPGGGGGSGVFTIDKALRRLSPQADRVVRWLDRYRAP